MDRVKDSNPSAYSRFIGKMKSLLCAVHRRVHYQKAQAYLYQYPIDEANSIKEIVSALECVSKAFFTKASTLGDPPGRALARRSDPRSRCQIIVAPPFTSIVIPVT
jgi:hypothetical protein